MQIRDEGLEVARAVVMGPLDEDDPARGQAGEGIAGIDDLRWPSLVSIIRGNVKFSVSGEEGIYYFSPNPVYEIALITEQEIKRPSLLLGQFLF